MQYGEKLNDRLNHRQIYEKEQKITKHNETDK